MEDLLTVNEIAEQLKVNPQTVRNWIDRGSLPAVRVGQRRVRVRRSDFDSFLEARVAKYGGKASRPHEASNHKPELWRELGTALAESVAALAHDDRSELIRTLRALAEAADRLAEALATTQ